MTNANNGGAERVTSEDVAGRREAQVLARTDVRRALAVARAIRHPWYRCQALASVADAMSAPAARDAALTEAVEAAFQQLEPNRVACAASWPLRVMVRHGHVGVRRLVGRLLNVLAKEAHGLRRLDGLAAVIGPLLAIPELRTLAWPSFLAAANASTGWRTERIVSWMAAALAEYDKPAALRLLAADALRRILISESAGPMSLLLSQVLRTSVLDDHLVEMAKDAVQPAVRARAQTGLLTGKAVWVEARRWHWVDVRYCKGRMENVIGERSMALRAPLIECLHSASN